MESVDTRWRRYIVKLIVDLFIFFSYASLTVAFMFLSAFVWSVITGTVYDPLVELDGGYQLYSEQPRDIMVFSSPT